jgi:hypothetical protein
MAMLMANFSRMERETACNGNSMAISRWRGGKILQWQREGELLNDGEAACNGIAMAIWRRHGNVALMTILQW